MPPDPSDTKRRILEAAHEEFARYGFAGARVDRIATAAHANKASIYAHFGPKRELFGIVLSDALVTMTEAAQYRPDDVAGYVARVSDILDENPDVYRLIAWANLEELGPTAVELESYRIVLEKLHWIYGEDAAYALAILTSMATAWQAAPRALRALAPRAGGSIEQHQRFRSLLLDATQAAFAHIDEATGSLVQPKSEKGPEAADPEVPGPEMREQTVDAVTGRVRTVMAQIDGRPD